MREAGDIQVKSVCLYDSHWLKAEGIIALECEALQGNEKKIKYIICAYWPCPHSVVIDGKYRERQKTRRVCRVCGINY